MGKTISRFLGSRKPDNSRSISDHDRAILDLKVARDRLKRYQIKLDSEAGVLVKQAQALVHDGRKDRALVVLKIKKLKLEQVSKADAQLYTVTELLETVEWEGHQIQVLAALSEGTKALNALHAFMPVEEVEKLMDDTQEALEYEAQISSMIAGSWSSESDEALLAEFEELQREIALEEESVLVPEKPVEIPQMPAEIPIIPDEITTAKAEISIVPVDEETGEISTQGEEVLVRKTSAQILVELSTSESNSIDTFDKNILDSFPEVPTDDAVVRNQESVPQVEPTTKKVMLAS